MSNLGSCNTSCLNIETAFVGVWGEVDQHLVKKASFHQLFIRKPICIHEQSASHLPWAVEMSCSGRDSGPGSHLQSKVEIHNLWVLKAMLSFSLHLPFTSVLSGAGSYLFSLCLSRITIPSSVSLLLIRFVGFPSVWARTCWCFGCCSSKAAVLICTC